MTDEELLRLVRAGDREAFRGLVERYEKPLTMMILRMVGNKWDAMDISQQAFLKAYESLSLFQRRSSFKTWLYKLAINKVRDHLRGSSAIMVYDSLESVESVSESPAQLLEKEMDLRRFRAAVSELPERQRLTLILRVYEGLDYQTISEILGGRASGARGNFTQAINSLRKRLTTGE